MFKQIKRKGESGKVEHLLTGYGRCAIGPDFPWVDSFPCVDHPLLLYPKLRTKTNKKGNKGRETRKAVGGFWWAIVLTFQIWILSLFVFCFVQFFLLPCFELSKHNKIIVL